MVVTDAYRTHDATVQDRVRNLDVNWAKHAVAGCISLGSLLCTCPNDHQHLLHDALLGI